MERTFLSNIIRSATSVGAVREIIIQPYVQRGQDHNEPKMEESPIESPEELLKSAHERADEIIRQAEAHAQRIKQESQLQTQLLEKEWEKARLAAEREGYDAGFSAGETQAQSIYEDLINHAQSIVETTQSDLVRSLEQSEPLMIELASELAKRILGTALNEDIRMKQFMTEILYEVKEYALVKVYVHPKWYDKLHQHSLELQQQMVGCRDFQIVPDVKMEETDCIVLTNAGKLHASLDTQLDELKKQLLQFTGKMYVETTY